MDVARFDRASIYLRAFVSEAHSAARIPTEQSPVQNRWYWQWLMDVRGDYIAFLSVSRNPPSFELDTRLAG